MIRSRTSSSKDSPSSSPQEDNSKALRKSKFRWSDYILFFAVVVVFYQFSQRIDYFSSLSLSSLTPSSPSFLPQMFYSQETPTGKTRKIPSKSDFEAKKQKLTEMQLEDSLFDCPSAFIEKFPEQPIDYSRVHKRNFMGMKGEDKYLFQHFFQRKLTPGTFIEIGGVDGIGLSNSLVFERDLGWTGVLIEPQTTNYAKLEVNRANSTTLHAAVCLEPGLIAISGSGGQAVAKKSGSSWALCEPMSSLLDRTELKHVDLYSIDVEGGELDLLVSHDFGRVPAFALIVEMRDYPRLRELNRVVSNALYSEGLCRFGRNVGHFNDVWVNMSFPIDVAPIA